jgi:sulfite reductase (ferredoxin)
VGHLLSDFIPANDVYAVTSAVKHLFDKYGNRKNRHAARLRFLWNTLGEARFRQLYDEQLEIVRRVGAPELDLEDLPQESNLPSFAPEQNHSPEYYKWKDRYVENQKQDGLVSVRVPIFLGNLKNTDARRLAEFLAPFGNHVLRASFGQNLRLRNIPKSYLANVFHLVHEISTLSSGPSLMGNSIACTGADTCRLGICLPKGALTATSERLTMSDLNLDEIADFKLNISGCPNSCGQHVLADLGFYGNVGRTEQQMFPAYMVVAGAEIGDGKARLARPVDRVSARDLPEFVHDVLKLWIAKKKEYSSFAAYVDADGVKDIREIASRYREIPSFDADKSYYQDWGAKDFFSLVGRGVGECSAGLFDLIEVDLNNARRVREKLRASESQNVAALYEVALRSARALLITRSIEAATDAAVFENFEKHFIQSGLIDKRFASVTHAAHQKNNDELARLEEEIFELLNAVEALYRSMDNSLRFPAEATLTA